MEAIVDNVHKTAEIKKLHLEIGELADDDLGLVPELDVEEAEDLERRIGREIETFLALERETDAQLREL